MKFQLFNASKILIIIEWLKINRPVLAVAIFTSILSSLVFLAVLYEPDLTHALYLSTDTPWGIVTSIFLHGDLAHLSGNILFLWLWTGYVIFQDGLLSMEEIRRRLKSFIPIVFGAAIVANVIWLIASRPGSNSQGASGLVFAVLGTAVGFLLMNIRNVTSRLKDPQITKRRRVGALISNLTPLAFLLVLIVFYTDLFLVIAQGVNVFVHGTAFLIGLFAVWLRELFIPLMQHTISRLLNSAKETRN